MKNSHLFQPTSNRSKTGQFSPSPPLPLFLLLLFLSLSLTACGGEANSDREATVTALGQAVILTATAEAEDEETPRDLLVTAEAAATEIVATIAAVSAEATATVLAATAEAAAYTPTPPPSLPPPADPDAPLSPAEIGGELLHYGFDPTAGELIWLHPDVILAGQGLTRFQPGAPLTTIPLQNFVLTADVMLAAPGSACGFAFHANDLTQIGDQQLLLLGPAEQGSLVLQSWQGGAFTPDAVLFANPFDTDPQFNLEPGSANRLAVVAQGGTFTVYTNGVLAAEFTPETQFGGGLTALATLSEFGVGACHFAKGWLWVPAE